MYKITCEECKHWVERRFGGYGQCTLGNIWVPGDATCEYAEEEKDDDEG